MPRVRPRPREGAPRGSGGRATVPDRDGGDEHPRHRPVRPGAPGPGPRRGFAITITPVEYTTLLDDQTRGDFQALQLGWSGRVDPHGNIGSFLGTGGGNNYPGYSDPEVDDLIARAAQATDQQERADLYGQLVTKVQQDDPIIYLYRTRSITGVSSDVAGVSTYADGVVRLSQAAFVEGSDK